MPCRQLDPVHADRDQCVRGLCGLHRHPCGPAVDRTAHQLVGLGSNARELEHTPQRHPRPPSGADQVAADLVRDARDRRVVLLETERDELVEVEDDVTLHAAVHAQAPAVAVDARDADRRIDAEELVDGREDRRETRDACGSVLRGGDRRQWRVRTQLGRERRR